MSLSPTARTNICTVLAALVNAGGVRTEDQSDVTTALGALQSELASDEANITTLEGRVADLETRVSALEDLTNDEEQALKPPAAEAATPAAPAAPADGEADTAETASVAAEPLS